jgi:signal transduction histidine kinase
MANDWSEIFDNYGIKRVSATDRSKSAYLPSKDQQVALAAAGYEPGNAEDKDFIEIEVLGEDHAPLVTSYYNSRRQGSGRDPEVRMGRGIVSWSAENDELVIGNIGQRVYVAKSSEVSPQRIDLPSQEGVDPVEPATPAAGATTPAADQSIQFRPRARIIRTIGDQLISGPEAAVIELVKNAYDADASKVIVKFIPPLEPGAGRITVSDDGHGMTIADIQDKWMEPATSSKIANRKSPRKNRVMLGSKGIGRFAAAKLGQVMELTTISDRAGDRTEVLIPRIDWSVFNGDAYLSDIRIDYLSQQTTEATGTTIEIVGLNESWSAAKMGRLLLELRKLISPIHTAEDEDAFRIFLDLSDCTEASCGFDGRLILGSPAEPEDDPLSDFEVVPFPLLTACDYEVDGYFDDAGTFHGTMQIKRANQGPTPIVLSVPIKQDEESCGRVDVRFYVFDRETDIIKATMQKAGMGEITAKEARRILDEVAGIAIYRDGFRIRPYGDAANDWLTLDTRRVQDPSLRIGQNQIAGFLGVETQETSSLVEKSSREGFEQNAAFARLTRLIRELLAQVVEPRRQRFREDAGIARRNTTSFEEIRKLGQLNKIRALVKDLPSDEREHALAVIDEQEVELRDRIAQIEERQRVLEAKSSLGAIVGEVLHEGGPHANYVAQTGAWLVRNYDSLFTNGPRADEIKKDYPKKLSLIAESGEKLRGLVATLRPLSGGKRPAPAIFNPVNVVKDAAAVFDSHNIPITFLNPEKVSEAVGYKGDLSTAVVNIVGNAVHWLEQTRTPGPNITIAMAKAGDDFLVLIDDNGPGVPDEFVERIFEVGFTTKDEGTGWGLNIAREALARSDATLGYDREYEGGARFVIRFPALKES